MYCHTRSMVCCLNGSLDPGTYEIITPWKFNSSHLKISHRKRKVIFQPSFFRGMLNFGGVYTVHYTYSLVCRSVSISNLQETKISHLQKVNPAPRCWWIEILQISLRLVVHPTIDRAFTSQVVQDFFQWNSISGHYITSPNFMHYHPPKLPYHLIFELFDPPKSTMKKKPAYSNESCHKDNIMLDSLMSVTCLVWFFSKKSKCTKSVVSTPKKNVSKNQKTWRPCSWSKDSWLRSTPHPVTVTNEGL